MTLRGGSCLPLLAGSQHPPVCVWISESPVIRSLIRSLIQILLFWLNTTTPTHKLFTCYRESLPASKIKQAVLQNPDSFSLICSGFASIPTQWRWMETEKCHLKDLCLSKHNAPLTQDNKLLTDLIANILSRKQKPVDWPRWAPKTNNELNQQIFCSCKTNIISLIMSLFVLITIM